MFGILINILLFFKKAIWCEKERDRENEKYRG